MRSASTQTFPSAEGLAPLLNLIIIEEAFASAASVNLTGGQLKNIFSSINQMMTGGVSN
jgi:hypothetical protein